MVRGRPDSIIDAAQQWSPPVRGPCNRLNTPGVRRIPDRKRSPSRRGYPCLMMHEMNQPRCPPRGRRDSRVSRGMMRRAPPKQCCRHCQGSRTDVGLSTCPSTRQSQDQAGCLRRPRTPHQGDSEAGVNALVEMPDFLLALPDPEYVPQKGGLGTGLTKRRNREPWRPHTRGSPSGPAPHMSPSAVGTGGNHEPTADLSEGPPPQPAYPTIKQVMH